MKKIWIFLLILCLLCAGCGYTPDNTASDTAYTFTDDLGRTVTVDQPKNVAVLLGSFAQVWQLAGGHVAATAEDAWEDLGLPLEDAVNLGGTKSLNLELLLSADPDFVLASANTRQHVEWLETLEAAGIPVAYFDVGDFDDYLRLLRICTDITGRVDLYLQNGLSIQNQIDAVIEQSYQRLANTATPTVLCLTVSASSIRAQNSVGTVLGEMLRTLGCVNIADSEKTLLENVSLEYILMADPDYIFIVQRGDDTEGMLQNMARELESNPLWAQLTAVKEGRIHIMEKSLYNLKPNHRWAEAYEKLEAILADE